MKKNKALIIITIIAALIIAGVIGTYAFELGAFLFKVMVGIVAIIIFTIGLLIGRFFPYKKKKKQLLKD
jgi:undecaprenyl pyrophosphate phosphatase UppP